MDSGSTDDASTRSRTSPLAFWPCLTRQEQQELESLSERTTLPAGSILCRETEPASRVIVILSGWAKVSLAGEQQERVIAFRGPGDLVGERAALLIRSRSATVVALETMEVLLIPAEGFATFLEDHVRALALLERQVYTWLTEDRGSRPTAPTAIEPEMARRLLEEPPPLGEAYSWSGQNCSILLTDIASFSDTVRDDGDRRVVRRVMYDLLRESFDESNAPWTQCYREDRGDGILLIVPPDIPTSFLVDPLLARLASKLRRHNRQSTDTIRIQLRIALHVGPVTPDSEGVTGEAIIHAARLLEAPIFKAELATAGADLGFIASQFVYTTAVKHAEGLTDPETYRQIKVRVKETKCKAWIYFVGDSSRVRPLGSPIKPAVKDQPKTSVTLGGNVDVRGDLVLGNKIEYHT